MLDAKFITKDRIPVLLTDLMATCYAYRLTSSIAIPFMTVAATASHTLNPQPGNNRLDNQPDRCLPTGRSGSTTLRMRF